MTDGGTCAYVQGVTRGSKMFPRFFVAYASNGARVTNATLSVVTFTLPDGTHSNATWHRASVEGVGFFIGKVYPNWNSTWAGNYMPTATATDIYGNTLSFTYTGRPFQILPSPLTASVQLVDPKTGQVAAGLYSGQTVNVTATIAYTAEGVTGTEIRPGYIGPLDTSRGGVVTALLGWDFYNTTSNSFGSAKNPGGQIASLKLTYTGSKGIWSTPLTISSLPAIPAGTTYELILSANDGVPTPNSANLMLAPPPATVQTTTTTSVSLATTTATSTATSIATSVSTAISTSLSTVTATQTSAQSTAVTAQATSLSLYAVMALIVLVEFAMGFIVRRPRVSS